MQAVVSGVDQCKHRTASCVLPDHALQANLLRKRSPIEDVDPSPSEPVQDELASTISKVDRVKQLLLFPAVEGYRFRAGSGRVFLGSKDLFVSELAASFHFSCHRAVGSDGRPKVCHLPPPLCNCI